MSLYMYWTILSDMDLVIGVWFYHIQLLELSGIGRVYFLEESSRDNKMTFFMQHLAILETLLYIVKYIIILCMWFCVLKFIPRTH